jgi:hypothetical protein
MIPAIEMKLIDIDSIHVDPAYQRDLDEKRVKKVAAKFKQGAAKAVSLSRRPNGSLWCYDGQHTIEIYRAAGFTHVPAVIVNGDMQKEADWFEELNQSVRRVSARDRQRAGVVAEKAPALAVQDLLDKFGIQVSKGGLRAGMTNSVGAIGRYVASDPARIDQAMKEIDAMWSYEPEAWSGVVLRGMFEACGKVSPIDLVKACKARRVTPRRILDWCSARQTAAGASGGGAAYACEAVLTLAGISA